jgi:hypothetical protein
VQYPLVFCVMQTSATSFKHFIVLSPITKLVWKSVHYLLCFVSVIRRGVNVVVVSCLGCWVVVVGMWLSNCTLVCRLLFLRKLILQDVSVAPNSV